MSMIADAHQSSGVMVLAVAGMLLLIRHLRARARRSRAWKIQVRPGDRRYRRRAPGAATLVLDPRLPAGSPTARRGQDDRPRARSRRPCAVGARRPAVTRAGRYRRAIRRLG